MTLTTEAIMEVLERSENKALHQIIFFLLALLIANPIVLFMLFENVFLSLLITAVVIVAVQFSYLFLKRTLITIYLLNFLLVVSLFFHAEVVFENNFSEYIIEDLYTIEDGYYLNKPNLDKRFDDKEYSVDYITNNQGYRIGYGQHVEDSISQVDWLFVGDSFTQGAQVEFEQLYTTELYRNFPDKIILNVGISGFGIVEEYQYYKTEGYKLGAEKVFLQLCNFNDFMNVRERQPALTDYLMHYSDFIRFLLQDIKYSNPEALPLGRWTEPFYPEEKANQDYNIFYTVDSEVKKKDIASFNNYLELFHREVTNHGAELVVVLIPTKEQVRYRYLQEVVEEFQIDVSKLNMYRPNHIVETISDSLGIQVVDLLEPFQLSDREPFFDYDEHLSFEGHQLIAEILAGALVQENYSEATILGYEIAGERYPMYSNDGSAISFQAMSDGNMEIFVSDPLFEEVQRLTFNDIDESHPVISPTLEQIAFTQGDPETFETDVGLMYRDGTGRYIITSEENLFGAIPSFSSDGLQLAFAQWNYDLEEDKYSTPQIVVYNLEDGSTLKITQDDKESWRPVFSPSGAELAYIVKIDGQYDLFLYDIQSGKEINLTSTPYDEWDPQFSSKGDYIVYSSFAEDNWDLFVIRLETGEKIQLTKTLGDEWDASFAPSDDHLLFAGKFGFLKGMYKMPFPERGD